METISIREAAQRLGVSHKVIRRLIQQGKLSARKVPGAHGVEWAVEASSLEASPPELAASRTALPQDQAFPGDPSGQGGPGEALPQTVPMSGTVESLQADKAFLQRQVEALTAILGQSVGNPARPTLPAGTEGETASPEEALPAAESPASVGFGGISRLTGEVTAALQSSLRTIGTDEITALEMCSVRVLWGKPVLWRVVASEAADVAAMLSAILSDEAAWDLPGAEVVFLWALDPEGRVLWGTACGSRWFGEPFEAALRVARVERR